MHNFYYSEKNVCLGIDRNRKIYILGRKNWLMHFKDYSKMFVKITGSKRLFCFRYVLLNLENIFLSNVSRDKITFFGIVDSTEEVILYFWNYKKSIP